jgi:hypothetical protein
MNSRTYTYIAECSKKEDKKRSNEENDVRVGNVEEAICNANRHE